MHINTLTNKCNTNTHSQWPKKAFVHLSHTSKCMNAIVFDKSGVSFKEMHTSQTKQVCLVLNDIKIDEIVHY